ncbi:hypothetical protein BDV96DRAFT_691638 [Lophiotrema nucula]|uniref:Uncharacterized protein n=1 Tax=Lophiotrema nucula TaxID=690887 RepID=A0A6A5YU34_9PLEO|nr:hypothetical protein BDV96DRAFT_691638 [Lophiotrema nucula]
MGRKRKGRASQWTDEDLAELLANLDHLLDGGPKVTIGGMNQKEVDARINLILSNLEKKMASKYSAQQIKQKLFETYKMGDPDNAEWNWRSVFSWGSSQMRSLDKEMRDLIRTKVLIIECMTEGRQPRAASHYVETPKKMRQGLSTYHNAPRSRKRNKRSTTSATPTRVIKSRTSTPRQSSRKRRTIVAQHPLIASPVSHHMKKSRSAIPETPPPQSPLLSEPIESVRNHPRAQRVEVRITNGLARRTEDAPRVNNIGHQGSTQFQNRYDIHYEDSQVLLAELFALRKELDLEREENRALKRERAERDAFMSRTHGDSNEFMKELKRKQRRINDLKAQQDEHAFLKPFFTLSTGQLKDLDLPLVQRKHASMRSQLVDIGMINDFRAFPRGKQRAQLLAASHELQALQRQLSSHARPDVESGPIAEVSAQHLVQSLVAVAVRDWVFYERFTSTATMEVPLLDAYRHHLSNLCDPEVLRSIDFAAHRRVFDQNFFKEAIFPKMASRLERRLIVALGPILPSRPRYNEGDEEADEALLRQRLNGIFCDALELKLLAMVSKDMFECIWPPLDTPFDPDTMETERTRFCVDDAESNNSKRVRLVLVPGLRSYEHDRQMVDYFGFKREHEQCTGSYRTLQKAVVLV